MRSAPPPSAPQPRTRSAETGRIRAVVSGPRWQAGAQYAAGFRSRGLEAFASRTLHVAGGTLTARTAMAYGSTREFRQHVAYSPKLHLGPLRFSFGAGAAYRPLLKRRKLKTELTGAALLRFRFISARLGWELQPERGTLRVAPGLAGHLVIHGGPVALDLRYRPGSPGLTGTASARWGY